jgi:hypothetical protein
LVAFLVGMYPTLLGEPPLLAGELIVLRRCADKYGMKAKPDSRPQSQFSGQDAEFLCLFWHRTIKGELSDAVLGRLCRRPKTAGARLGIGQGKRLSGGG